MSAMSLVDSVPTLNKDRKSTGIPNIKRAFASIPLSGGKRLFESAAPGVIPKRHGDNPQEFTYHGSNSFSNYFLDHSQPELFVTTVWKKSGFYLKWRYFGVAFVFFVMLFSFFDDWEHYKMPSKWFIFLQNWGHLTLSTCVSIQAYTATLHAIRDPLNRNNAYPSKVTGLMKLMWLTYNISLPLSYLVLLAYLIFHFDIKNVVHGLSFFGIGTYVFVDQMVCGIPLRYQHFYQLSSFMSIYLAFTVIYANTKGTNYDNNSYIYSYLDWSNTETEAKALLNTLLFMFLVAPAMWSLAFAIYKLRDRYLIPLLQKKDIDDELHICTFGTIVATVGTIIVPHVAAEWKKKTRVHGQHARNVKIITSELSIAFHQ